MSKNLVELMAKFEKIERRLDRLECLADKGDDDEPEPSSQPVEFKCAHCGKSEGTWFDRTISYNSKGEETGMAIRCNACGMDIDEPVECKHIWITGAKIGKGLWEGKCKICGISSEDKPVQPSATITISRTTIEDAAQQLVDCGKHIIAHDLRKALNGEGNK